MGCHRFIPACAGNSVRCRSSSRFTPVHPRLRGELTLNRYMHSQSGGSSPLARGTRFNLADNDWQFRFIPACAGNSLANTRSSNELAVHPRLRGELRRRGVVGKGITGSSPLARGTRIRSFSRLQNDWFIPACAGNSFFDSFSFRNEYDSSPLARGTRV